MVSIAVTGGCVWVLLSTDLVATLPGSFAAADGVRLVFLCLATAAAHLLRAWRLSLCLERHTRLLTRRAFAISTWHSFWISVLPARTGELTFVVMLSCRYGRGVADAVGLLLLFRMLDLLVVCAIGGTAAWFALAQRPEWDQWRALLGAGGIAAALGVAGLLALCFVARAYLPKTQPRNIVLRWLHQALTAAVALTWRRFAAVWSVSIAMWMGMTLAIQQGLLAIETAVSFATAGMVSAAAILSFAMPVNGVASVGPFEGAWTATAVAAGHDAANALAAAILAHILFLAVTAVMLLPAVLLRR